MYPFSNIEQTYSWMNDRMEGKTTDRDNLITWLLY